MLPLYSSLPPINKFSSYNWFTWDWIEIRFIMVLLVGVHVHTNAHYSTVSSKEAPFFMQSLYTELIDWSSHFGCQEANEDQEIPTEDYKSSYIAMRYVYFLSREKTTRRCSSSKDGSDTFMHLIYIIYIISLLLLLFKRCLRTCAPCYTEHKLKKTVVFVPPPCW